MNLTNMMHNTLRFIMNNTWLIQVLAIIIVTCIAAFVEKKIYFKLHPKLVSTSRIWDDLLLLALHKPLKVLIWLFGAALSLEVILTAIEASDKVVRTVRLTEKLLIVVGLIWFLARYIKNVEDRYIARCLSEGKKIERSNIRAVGQLSRIGMVIIGVLFGLQVFNVPISGLLAVGGVGGLVLGLAAKDTLANFFGGFMIFFDRSFTVGDWIYSPDKDIEGTVEYIGWRLTCIRRFDLQPLYLPNGMFSTIGVINASRMENRRIKAEIGVRYEDATKISAIVEDAEKMLREHPDIDSTKTCFVKFVAFDQSSLNFQVYTFTKTVDWIKYLTVQQDVYLKIIDIIVQHGASCAFPTTTLKFPHPVKIQSD